MDNIEKLKIACAEAGGRLKTERGENLHPVLKGKNVLTCETKFGRFELTENEKAIVFDHNKNVVGFIKDPDDIRFSNGQIIAWRGAETAIGIRLRAESD